MRSSVGSSISRGRIAATPLECGNRYMSASTRPWGLEYEVNRETLSARRRVSLDTCPCKKLKASAPVNRKIPKCARRAEPSTAAVVIGYEMGAAATMSTPGAWLFYPKEVAAWLCAPVFWQTFSCDADLRRQDPQQPPDADHRGRAGSRRAALRGCAACRRCAARDWRTRRPGADALRRLGTPRPLHRFLAAMRIISHPEEP